MSDPAVFTFDPTYFREKFPLYADPLKYPDALLQSYWDTATCFISANNFGALYGDCRFYAINLMTAHLTFLGDLLASGGPAPQIINGATIQKISITLTPPPVDSQEQWWWNTSPYGMQFNALLQAKSAGGYYISPVPPQLTGFRNNYGVFG